MKKSPYERLWKHIVKGANEDDCWSWVGGKNNVGYPMIKGKENRTMVLAHKVMAEHMGLTGPEIQRTCDSYECLNPKHLKSGTTRERVERVMADPDFAFRKYRHKHTYVPCPVCNESVYFPTMKITHKECFPDYKKDK